MGKSRDTGNLTSKTNLFSDIVNDRVGVGTATPTEKLHVIGDTLIDGVATGTLLIANDRVGVGTATPTEKLHVIGDTLIDGVATVTLLIANDKVGVGTATPTEKLHVIGDTLIDGVATVTLLIANDKVGVGTATPTEKLHVIGDTLIDGVATVTSLVESSSIILKENISPIENALDKILQLNPVTYDRKNSISKNEAGLIAEEVEKIIPNIVSKDDEGNPEGINYTKLTVYLIDAVKTLTKELRKLKNGDS